jgi:hypothetical protein
VHEVRKGRPLAFFYGSLRQLAYLFYWRDSSAEEGAWLWQAICHLEGFLAISFP